MILKYIKKFDIKIISFFLLIFLFNSLPQFYLWDHITDDAYISFRYTERMLDGKGLTFNDGERVEGFSNPLWIFIIAISSQIFQQDISTTARILGFLFSNIIFFFIYLIARKYLDKSKSQILLIFVFILLFFTPGFHVYSTIGLEGPLLSFLIISASYFSISKNKNHLRIAALLVGLVGVCRPEGLLYVLLWLIFTFKFDKLNILLYLLRIIIALIPSIIYEAFRLYYYGDILPNTAYAKPSGTYSFLFGIDDSFLYLIIISLPLTVIIIFYFFRSAKYQNNFFVTISGFLLANFIFLIYAGGDWMLLGRFILPIWPIILIAFSYLLLFFLNEISKDSFEFKYLSYLCLISIIITQILLFKEQWFEYKSNENIPNVMKGKDQLDVGEWLNYKVKHNSTVATLRLGGISYGAPNLVFYDTFGLTDKEVTDFRRQKNINYDVFQNPVIKRRPNILAIINDHGNRILTVETMRGFIDYLEKNYILKKSFPQGTGVFFEIWVDKNRIDTILTKP